MTPDDLAAAEHLADLLGRIAGLAALLGADELAALELCAHGLARSRETYGPLVVSTDPRDFAAEAIEELRDTMVYAAAELLRLRRRRGTP